MPVRFDDVDISITGQYKKFQDILLVENPPAWGVSSTLYGQGIVVFFLQCPVK